MNLDILGEQTISVMYSYYSYVNPDSFHLFEATRRVNYKFRKKIVMGFD